MRRWTDYQLSRLELAFAIMVILVILSVIMNRALVYFTVAERALITNTVVNIDTALRFETARRLIENDRAGLGKIQGMNPMILMEKRPVDYDDILSRVHRHAGAIELRLSGPPADYLGELANPDPASIPKGSWYFDLANRELVYKLVNPELFRSSLEGPARIRFQVAVSYKDRNGNGSFDPEIDDFDSARLRALDEYEWLL
jgi:hypothetical protein